MTLLPADLPGLREEAERLAREWQAAFDVAHFGPAWDELGESGKAAAINAHTSLLRDLTRQASRDWALRWLTEKMGITPPGRWSPSWYKFGKVWFVSSEGGETSFADTPHIGERRVPGLHVHTDPDEALAMVCAHVGRQTKAAQ